MRDVALTAAIFAGAFFMAPAGSAVSNASFMKTDTPNINSIINKPTTHATVTRSEQTAKAASPKSQTAQVNLAAADVTPATDATPAPQVTTVQSGDTLTTLATSNGTTAERLYAANPSVESPDVIQPGQQLRVPAADEQLASRQMPVAATPEQPATQASTTTESAAPAAEVEAAAPAAQPATSAPAVADGGVWDRLAMCEASGNWAANTGNGFYGGLQFTVSSWAAVGGSGMPNQASREEQIMRAQQLQAMQGWGAWPACTSKLGLR